ncbi:hypothetical protein [Pseudactinotalea sp. HY160]|nr:hypothetical protein [Pseudactinotalea sp. HY160]
MSEKNSDPSDVINTFLRGRGKWAALGLTALLVVVFAVKAVTG